MTGILLCLAAMLSSYVAARRSLGRGLAIVIAWGYFYGILRAYFAASGAYFLFDSALLGLYAVYFGRRAGASELVRTRSLRLWAATLVAWPFLLLLLPFQQVLISLVGLRAMVLPIPAMLLAASLRDEDLSILSVTLSLLNLIVLIFAVAEYTLGLARIFPQNNATALMFQMNDVANYTAYRIPGTFSQAHVYAGTMICTIPLLFAAWAKTGKTGRVKLIFMLGLAAALLGILLAAARMAFVMSALIMLFAIFKTQVDTKKRLALYAVIGCIAFTTVKNERLQRFTSLSDGEYVQERIAGSVNRTFFELLVEYPMGNGLGGGGTSIPYFLEQYIRNPVALESEYARIMLEQSIFGLLIWLAFLAWVFTRATAFLPTTWRDGRRLAWFTCLLFFCSAMIGIGLFTAVPSNVMIFAMIGWFSVRPASEPHTSSDQGRSEFRASHAGPRILAASSRSLPLTTRQTSI
jgi:hypothetical protein